MSGRRTRLAIAANLALAALCIGAWLRMALGFDGTGRLVSMSWGSMKYFTILSNLFCALTALIAAGLEWGILRGRRENLPLWAAALKMAGTAAVGLTFLVVITFLAPLYGYPDMYRGGNFLLHGLNPVLAALILILLEAWPSLGWRVRLTALLPPLMYSVYYYGVILTRGVMGNDFYSFARWGVSGAILITVIIAAAIIGFCWAVEALRGRVRRKAEAAAEGGRA